MTEQWIREIFEQQGGRPCLTCSFQAEDVVVLDMLRKLRPDIAVLFLDTGYHFPETYEYCDRMVHQWNINLIVVQPALPVAAHEAEHGRLFETRPDRCCNLRKVEPLLSALADYEIWFTGLRREQSPTRAGLSTVEAHTLPGGKSLTKVSPLALWNAREVWNYLRVNKIDYHPLYDQGYTSIGCNQCTTLPRDPADPRSGRWSGQKLECGIHTFDSGRKSQ